MIKTTATRSGWTLEITHQRNGMLEQGGVCGARYYWSYADMAKVGVAGSPGDEFGDGMTNEQYLAHRRADGCTRVLSHGSKIR
jgi:hypothetical protein